MSSACEGFTSRRLRSLLEIMRTFETSVLIELSKEIGRLTVLLQSHDQEGLLSVESQKTNEKVLSRHAETFRSLGFRMCAMKTEAMMLKVKSGVTIKEFTQHLSELYERMCDESRLFSILALNAQETALYEPTEEYFGKDVSTKFPSTAYEIDECTKCIALGRSTAAVFHMMRTMEIAIMAVATCLNIPPPTKDAERNWGRVLEKIKTEIERRNKTRAWNAADRHLFEEIYVSLDAVRVAWRNTTMHIERIYTGEEAEHVLASVRGLMRKIASRLDEKGLPLA